MNGTYLRGEIYFADLEHGVGSEQMGYRPVLIIQNDTGNKHSPTVIIAAISSARKKDYLPTHINLPKEAGVEEGSIIMLEQLRTLDKRRLDKFVGKVDDDTMSLIDDALMISVGVKQEKEKDERSNIDNEAIGGSAGREEMILCLCGICVRQFIYSPEHLVKKLNRNQKGTELCNYCQVRKGQDYRIARKISVQNRYLQATEKRRGKSEWRN